MPKVVVGAETTDGARRHGHHRARLSIPRAVPVGPGRDVDRVLQHARHRAVVLRGHEQDGVRRFDLGAKRDPGRWRRLIQVLVVEGKLSDFDDLELQVGRSQGGERVRDIAMRLALSESDLYRKQRVAITEVARTLADMEKEKLQQE